VTDKLQPNDKEDLEEIAPEDEETEDQSLDGTEEVEEQPSELEVAKREADEYLDGWQRARAELSNYKKRIEKEKSEMSAFMKGGILARYLPILDDLERALQDRPDSADVGAWAEGIELIYKKFSDIMEAEGVQTIAAEGETFDPALHEALSHEPSETHESGVVIEVIQHGYQIDERVIRPALVRVAK
jgi:molecular chaperone GrpE